MPVQHNRTVASVEDRRALARLLRPVSFAAATGVILWVCFRWVGGEYVRRLDSLVPYGYQCWMAALAVFHGALTGGAAWMYGSDAKNPDHPL